MNCIYAEASHQFVGVHLVQQQQQQQLTSSNIVYVQVPAAAAAAVGGGGCGYAGQSARPAWTGRHYLHAQSKCLGAVMVVAGSLSVVGNVAMAASDRELVGWYLARAILLAMMVSQQTATYCDR